MNSKYIFYILGLFSLVLMFLMKGFSSYLSFIFIMFIATPTLLKFQFDSIQKENDERLFSAFLKDFSASLSSGLSVQKSLKLLSEKDYSDFTKHIRKMYLRMKLGMPFEKAVVKMGKDTGNTEIENWISLILRAYKKGASLSELSFSISKSITSYSETEREMDSKKIFYFSFLLFLYFIVVVFTSFAAGAPERLVYGFLLVQGFFMFFSYFKLFTKSYTRSFRNSAVISLLGALILYLVK